MKFIALLGSPNAAGRTRLVAEAIATGIGKANGRVDIISVAGGPSDEAGQTAALYGEALVSFGAAVRGSAVIQALRPQA
jgi:hypothetical protein